MRVIPDEEYKKNDCSMCCEYKREYDTGKGFVNIINHCRFESCPYADLFAERKELKRKRKAKKK